jgi:hypothetical protein
MVRYLPLDPDFGDPARGPIRIVVTELDPLFVHASGKNQRVHALGVLDVSEVVAGVSDLEPVIQTVSARREAAAELGHAIVHVDLQRAQPAVVR